MNTIQTNTEGVKKTKKQYKRLPKSVIIEDEHAGADDNNVFIRQDIRQDILANMLANKILTGKELFDIIMSNNNTACSKQRKGDLYESLCEILLITKCIDKLTYLSSLQKVNNIKDFLSKPIHQGGNVSDLSIINNTTTICFSVKYNHGKVSKKETDINDLNSTLQKYSSNYKIGLFVKSKEEIMGSKKNDIHKEIFDEIIANDLLFDEKDIIKALDVFCQRFSNNTLNIRHFVEFINTDYLLSPRQQLTKKLHQQMTECKFINSFLTNKHKMWCIAHKPRSGKSITILLICKYLLENGYHKILIMTSVPATINSFTKDLENYIDFKNINYKSQEEFDEIDENFNGIVFCSVQYLKIDGKNKKKDLLKKIGFDAIVIDEAHQGSSTDKTKTEILDVDSDVEDIRANIKINIFATGTADKTKKYYSIHGSCIYEWEIEDEAFMKELINPDVKNRESIIEYMVNRHGNIFTQCLANETLNKDYLKCPTQVLMKHSIPKLLIDEIDTYNTKNGTNFGYSCSSLFALQQTTNNKGEIIYAEQFELCKTIDGIEILKGFFDCIISKNRIRNDTIMKQIENTQTSRGSRKSTIENPLLFIIYLPTHTRNNIIALLQKTFKQFLETYNLWGDYNIEYSNSSEDTGNVKEEYNEFIQTIMKKTKRDNKRGCILLLGNKGSVGITYDDCDVTISLDDGHNLDNQKQRFSRALTDKDGKTIGINVDMNIQRSYLYLIDIIQKHRKNTKTTKSNAEILYYLFEHNIFLFDPQQINNGKLTTIEIMSYYQRQAENIMKEIDDTPFLENLICDDDMHNFIKIDFKKKQRIQINKDLEGEQQNCPKGDKTKIQIDSPDIDAEKEKEDHEDENKLDEIENTKIELLINQTYEMCKSFLFPLLALISKSYRIFNFNDIFTSEKTGTLIILLLKDKKIELNKENYTIIVNIMSKIINNNAEIVNNIREIYSIAPFNKLRQLIEKHFIPTENERKENAEVPTSVVLVDEMLNTIPVEFWKTPRKVFEPCCGKGNFVLGIFDRFYKGLEIMYPDEIERCYVIMTQCIYYADITALNVFITTEIMKCHVQGYCGLDELDFEFNSYVGDTLELDMEEKWNITLEDVATIGNPPYSTDPSKPDTKPLYDKFIEKYINSRLLLFVVPTRWFIGGKGLDGFRDFMMKRKDIVFIQHEENSKKWFGNHVDIEGGVNYFLKDASYNGLCLFNSEPYDLSKYDCIVNPSYHKIIDIISNMESLSKLYMGRCFGIETNDKRFKDTGKIKCYVSLKQAKNRCKYIDNYDFNEKNTFWKVITARANGKSPKFGEKFIGNVDEVHTGSYISFRVNNQDEAKYLLSYLETKFANHMLSIRKISQDISENTCKWIPLVPLDRIWTDDKVCEYLKIDQTMYI
jgi:site-specific DNA-methyltransferase (adenine-specific)